MKSLLNFFIKDYQNRSYEDLRRSRILVALFLIMGMGGILFFTLEFLEIFVNEFSLGSILLSVVALLVLKYTHRLTPVLIFVILGGTAVLLSNIHSTGMGLSYNNKWFVVILIFIYFLRPKWLVGYWLMSIVAIFVIFTLTPVDGIIATKVNLFEEFFDNLIFTLLVGSMLYMIDKDRKEYYEKLSDNEAILLEQTRKLKVSNLELENYAYMASHDIKSPLNNIISFSMLLEKELGNNSSLKASQYLSFIKSSGARLQTLITDVLDFSKVFSEMETPTKVNLTNLIDEIRASIVNESTKVIASIKVQDSLPLLLAQKSLINLLLTKLINNGIKYNDNEIPTVYLSHELTDEVFRLSIRDNGIGIDPKFQDKIFEMFSRLHSNADYDGSGLGLAFCHKIMQKYNGTIHLESEVDKGTIFHLKFPHTMVVV